MSQNNLNIFYALKYLRTIVLFVNYVCKLKH